ncbi:FabA-like domain protein [Brevibacillus fulvus]|uniref:3-hydroxyacyl-[acyl-carrier-protein] dehydratase n=1 Tax=Brevibacillus fulvus TaxID=1125967 RepID=A0A938Y0A3_9BACL|nr:FabA-like domain protein [Brevibacillus fulvus]MBM7589686.1 3-hydroxyacyl-[acyl-carrier-protein] dehydratase [Brevibacillus fulvus]
MIAEEMLANRKPWILVDKVIEWKEGDFLVAQKNITSSDFFVQGHFPQRSIYPGMLLVEGAKQSAELLLIASGYERQEFQLTELKAKFFRPILPGDAVRFQVNWVNQEKQKGNLVTVGLLDNIVVLRCNLKIL